MSTINQQTQMISHVHRAADDSGDDLGVVEAVPTLTLVFEAIRDMHNAGTEPTRERIVEMTGLKGTTVDDRIKRLRREGMITCEKQRYEPIHRHAPARAVSMTLLADGVGKLELGECLVAMVPQEMRQLALLLQGYAVQSTVVQRFEEMREQLLVVEARSRKMERAVAAKLKKAGAEEIQPSLL